MAAWWKGGGLWAVRSPQAFIPLLNQPVQAQRREGGFDLMPGYQPSELLIREIGEGQIL